MPYRDPRVTCEPWITADQLCCDGAQSVEDCNGDETALSFTWTDAQLIQAASDLLFARTCYKYPGVCTQTVWPCLGCGGCGAHPCGCGAYYAVWLQSDFPILSVDQITIDGVVVDPATYRLEENARIVKTDDEHWPHCNNLGLTAGPTTTSGSELLVTYTSGREAPAALQMAAAELVCELKKACNGDSSCTLPAHVRSVSRRGTSMEIDSVFSLLDSGLTGNLIIDHALYVYGKCPRAQAFDPLKRMRCGTQVVKVDADPPPIPDDLDNITFIDDADSPYTLLPDDEVVLVDSCNGPVTVLTPASHALDKWYDIKDAGCCSATNPITVSSADGDLIDGQLSYVIETDCQSIRLLSDATDFWMV